MVVYSRCGKKAMRQKGRGGRRRARSRSCGRQKKFLCASLWLWLVIRLIATHIPRLGKIINLAVAASIKLMAEKEKTRLKFSGQDRGRFSVRFFRRRAETGEEEGEEAIRIKAGDERTVTHAERLPFKVTLAEDGCL